jgi:hypothetical protein
MWVLLPILQVTAELQGYKNPSIAVINHINPAAISLLPAVIDCYLITSMVVEKSVEIF